MAFTLLRSQRVESLHVDIEEYEHVETGAIHFHIKANNKENVFLVAFRTVPKDSTGVAHILEHTVLCGSERYPVRDPFFMMIRRSLNTFMNAFTSSDWTAYPFASKNRKDFDNLLQVYLDSVFFARLDPLDFAQEGHRVEFAAEGDVNSDLEYKGVVYNEMKGAMSSPVSQLWQTLTKYVFPSTTYHHNSGGEPDHIVDLSYEQLQAFYKKHYHPSNAVFMTYGDIDAAEHQANFEKYALHRFSRLAIDTTIPDEKRYFSPVSVREAYPLADNEATEHKTHIVMGWLLGHSFDLETNLEAHLLVNVLFENSASPLLHALETTSLGHSPSPLCGLEDSNREMTFVCGIEGSDADKVPELEQLILSTLEKVAQEGVPKERVEAVLHQLELSQREISGDSYPYGLQLILSALPPLIHGGDAIELLDLEPVLVSLREKIDDPEYIKSLVKKLLLDNPHRVTLSLVPDTGLEAQRENYRKAQLAQLKSTLKEEQKQQVVTLAEQLKQRQARKDDDAVLPKVTVEDVPLHLSVPKGEVIEGAVPITSYKKGTNGLVYQQVIIALPELTEAQALLLSLYTYCLTEIGLGGRDYLAVQDWQSEVSGGISAYATIKGTIDDEQDAKGYLVVSGKALARNKQALADLLRATVLEARFDEHERLRELVSKVRAKKDQSVTSNGHALAMGVACSEFSSTSNLAYHLGGMSSIARVRALDAALESSENMAEFAQQLKTLHQLITQGAKQFLVVAEREESQQCTDALGKAWPSSAVEQKPFTLTPMRNHVKKAWLTSTQVNFCAKAYQTVPIEHEDAAPLTVLGNFLRNGYLHRAIREQGGAYGGGAGQDSAVAAFRFYSYRDPRLDETLADFDASITWMLTEAHEAQALEEAILGVVSQIDKPKSPAGEAKSAFHNNLFGRSAEQRERFRSRILAVTLDDLKRVCQTYLTGEASIGIVTSSSKKDALEAMGVEAVVL